MPAIGNIVLADAKPTPVNHTFTPVTTDGSKAAWANRAATIPKGFETLTLEVAAPSTPTGAYRISGNATFPTVATVDGQDVVVRESRASFTIYYSQLSSLQERKDIPKLLAQYFASATFVAVNENLESVY